MKKRSVFICLCILTVMAIQGVQAQTDGSRKLPVDPRIRYGKLANGLTYYIRHNELPKERAEFFIVQNVGSMQEEENQRGLAHVLEHMAFNGSLHFPKDTRSIDDFTESIGMRMGENLNAYTGFDETVYMLRNAPVTGKAIVDSCLLVLHDWSGFLTLADSMIEKERGVIREEWRTRTDAQSRLWEQQLPRMYPGSRYASRLPIGTIDVIDHFKPDELRDYYRKWYRPDLQAIIIVGDINVDEVEATVQTLFADIPAPVNPARREREAVPDNEEPLVSIARDKESTRMILSLYYKHDPVPDELKGTLQDYLVHYIRQVIAFIMQERFSELLQKASPPFINAYAGDGEYMIAKTKDAWTAAAIVKPDALDEAMNALTAETNRVKRFGFTAAENDRARTTILKMMESAYNEREKQKNGVFAEEFVRHFTDGECIPGIEMEYKLIGQLAPALQAEQVSQYARQIIGDRNIVISLTGPDKEGVTYPSEAELLEKFRLAETIPVEAYAEEAGSEPLIAALPAPGRIVDTRPDPLFGATLHTLSNGVKVILKETELKTDEILMQASSKGGSTLFDDTDANNLKLFNSVAEIGGLGDFSATQLNKALTGKNVSCNISLDEDAECISGAAVPADIRTLFELVYLSFTAPRSDEEAYASFEERIRGQLENARLNPMNTFRDSIDRALYGNQPRAKRLEAADIPDIRYDRIMEMYRERYADASDFVFTFVGNITPDSMIPMMEQYLATLPALHRTEQGRADRVPVLRRGEFESRFVRTMETPKASVLNYYSGQTGYDTETTVTAAMLEQILDLVYMEKVRENESGSYGVSASLGIAEFPEGQAFLQIYFDTDPALKDKLLAIVKDELQSIIDNGPREADFIKTRDNMLKRHEESLQENAYWLHILDGYYFRGHDWHTGYVDILNRVTPATVQAFARTLIAQGNHIEIVMEQPSAEK
ncbi:MAG: insulinase family protein [Tannerella sp.]|jgi:zinc protease|nr:insulinase family protein [Tannerella sp.]